MKNDQRPVRWKGKERNGGKGHPPTHRNAFRSVDYYCSFLPTADSLAETASDRTSNGGEGMDRGRIIQAGTIFFCESEIKRARLRPHPGATHSGQGQFSHCRSAELSAQRLSQAPNNISRMCTCAFIPQVLQSETRRRIVAIRSRRGGAVVTQWEAGRAVAVGQQGEPVGVGHPGPE